MAEKLPPQLRSKVMHATFKGEGFSFMASDGDLNKTVDSDAGNITLSLGTTDAAHAERVFNALAQDGNIVIPFEQAFWGGKFGTVIDKFGVEWMVSAHRA